MFEDTRKPERGTTGEWNKEGKRLETQSTILNDTVKNVNNQDNKIIKSNDITAADCAWRQINAHGCTPMKMTLCLCRSGFHCKTQGTENWRITVLMDEFDNTPS